MLNQTKITKVSGTTRKTILVDERNSTAFSVVVANDGVEAGSDGRKIIKAGTPVYGSLMARNTAFKLPGDIDPEASAVVTGTGITAAEVTASTFSTKVSGTSGTYEFVYDADAEAGTPDPSWKLGTDKVNLTQYGISVTGSAADGDKIVVTFVAGGTVNANAVVLHDVDVTDGNANSQVVVFGFIDVSKVDDDVKTLLLAAESSLDMIKLVQ